MDIKVGEYVKFKDGKIRQVIGRDEDNHLLVDINIYGGNWLTFNEEANITKHSFNLIDLIEVEDIVNGYRILNIVDLNNSDKKVFTICKSDFKDICKVWSKEDIKTILTHEQYNANFYKVKGE